MHNKSGPIALITGGSRGIGLTLARFFLERGYRIAITGRSQENLRKALGDLGDEGVIGLLGDASVPADIQNNLDTVMAQWGPIDLLVNNAGVLGPMTPFLDTEIEAMWKVQQVNLLGPMLFMKAVLPTMLERKNGVIINMGSYAAVRAIPGNPAYSASKAGLAKLTESVGFDLEGTGVRIFCVSPGLVETDMTRDTDLFKTIPKEFVSPPEAVCNLIERLVQDAPESLNGRFFHVTDELEAILDQNESIAKGNRYRLTLENLKGPLS